MGSGVCGMVHLLLPQLLSLGTVSSPFSFGCCLADQLC
jgi:hypothetical protein